MQTETIKHEMVTAAKAYHNCVSAEYFYNLPYERLLYYINPVDRPAFEKRLKDKGLLNDKNEWYAKAAYNG